MTKRVKNENNNLETNPYLLPPNLPVPIDDGACNHLRGRQIPAISLKSTKGRSLNVAELSRDPTVFFFYPETGKPGAVIPKDWDSIPGARGCTPQSCSFRDYYREFKELGWEVLGVSGQSLVEQNEFANRNNLPYELLNDSEFKLTMALQLPTFEFHSKTFIRRLAFAAAGSRVEKVFYPVFPPDKNAEMVLQYLKSSHLH